MTIIHTFACNRGGRGRGQYNIVFKKYDMCVKGGGGNFYIIHFEILFMSDKKIECLYKWMHWRGVLSA